MSKNLPEREKFEVNPELKWRWEGEDKILTNKLVVLDGIFGEILEICKKVDNVNDLIFSMKELYTDVDSQTLELNVRKAVNFLMHLNMLIPKGSKNFSTPTPISPKKYLVSHLGEKLSAPVWILAMVTYCCPAACEHCFVPITKKRDPRELTTREWKKVLDELVKMNVFSITFSGGEPLARDDLVEIVSYANGKGLYTALQTNGFFVTEKKANELVSAGLKEVWISLDGARSETHDSFRHLPGLFNRAIRAAKLFVEKGLYTGVITVISKYNINEVTDILELVYNLGIKHIALARPIRHKPYIKKLEPSFNEFIDVVRKVFKKEEKLIGLNVSYPPLPTPIFEKSIGMGNYKEILKKGKLGECDAGIFCTVNPVGDVTPCDVSCEVSLGNLRKKTFKEIWEKSPILKHLRIVSKEKQSPCSSCTYRDSCFVGCNALPWQVSNVKNIYKASPECEECFNTLIKNNEKVFMH